MGPNGSDPNQDATNGPNREAGEPDQDGVGESDAVTDERSTLPRLSRRRVIALSGGAVALGAGAWVFRPAPVSASLGWSTRAAMPSRRGEMKAAALDGRIYVPGGLTGVGGSTNRLDVYDIETDEWTEATGMPRGLNHHGTATLEGQLFVVGGNERFTDPPGRFTYSYDPERDEWAERQALPDGRWGHELLPFADRLYVLGGVPDADDRIDTLVYDPVADAWERAAPMPTRREHVAAATLNDGLVVVSGRWDGENVSSVAVYDPATDRWDERTPIPTPRSGFGAATVDGELYAIGGEDPATFGGWTTDANERYDPNANEWDRHPEIPLAVHGHAVVEVAGLLYVIGGAWRQGLWSVTAWSDRMFVFDPAAD